jgi:hypothetical protein
MMATVALPVDNKTPPLIFINTDSKRVSILVSCLKSTLTDTTWKTLILKHLEVHITFPENGCFGSR